MTARSAVMAPAQREQFILDYLARHNLTDVLDAPFVDAYVQATGAATAERLIGAPQCLTLSRDLASLHRRGLLTRQSASVGGGPGWPTWVYVYSLA